jgi:RNA ligase
MKIKIPQEEIDKKYIRVNKHPDLDLYIYNYTQSAQFERHWNEWTMMCRGLVLDGEGNIVARPLPKFFNYEEPEANIPEDTEMVVFEKLDGSLIEIFKYQGQTLVVSRGSFTSDTAIYGKEILESKHDDFIDKIEEGKTYIFELISPTGRIVVDYGTKDDLVLLTIMDNDTANETLDYELGFEVVKKFDFDEMTLAQLQELDLENEEGFVCLFDGYRVKVKFANYVEKHRVVIRINEKTIWETLSSGGNVQDVIIGIPDELHRWANSICSQLTMEYNKVEREALSDYNRVMENMKMFYSHYPEAPEESEVQRDFADRVKEETHRSILFKMKKDWDYSDLIWKSIKPVLTTGFVGMGMRSEDK